MNENVFEEVQRFDQWWLWVLLVGMTVLIFWSPANLGALILFLVSLFFLVIRLKTRISEEGIRFRFFPFISRNYSWKKIESAEVVDYGFVGGWGIRLFTAYGTVYNVKGRKGLAVKMKNGKKFCVGTQRPSELQTKLSSILSKNDI